jgi:hypothetical protein
MLVAMTRTVLGRLTRDADATLLLESFFVAAVASFLGIRWFLALTGYPRIGSNGIHIAHMLWGGLLMLLALMLLFAYLDRWIQHLAAVIAGLGFGTFTDEIGKFVTADNDYFYRPAIALIYALFVVAFLVARALVGQRRLSQTEALANVLDLLEGTPDGPIEPDDRARIERLLALADPRAPLAAFAKQYVADLPPAPADRPGLLGTVNRRFAEAYEQLMANPWAERALSIAVIAYAAVAVLGVTFVAAGAPGGGQAETSSVASIAQIASTVAGAALVARGVLSLRRSRTAAYRWFMRGLLVWILVTQVFVFYSSQLAGLGGLALDLVAYGSLRFAVTRELVSQRRPTGGS